MVWFGMCVLGAFVGYVATYGLLRNEQWNEAAHGELFPRRLHKTAFVLNHGNTDKFFLSLYYYFMRFHLFLSVIHSVISFARHCCIKPLWGKCQNHLLTLLAFFAPV